MSRSIPGRNPPGVRASCGTLCRTGSPALPLGLNLGAQLFYQESLNPTLLARAAIVMPWPQYWSWLLSGVAASEVTSLGCHTDLWNPLTGTHSDFPCPGVGPNTWRRSNPRARFSGHC